MPFVSKKQEKYLKVNKPEVAKKFEQHAKYEGKGTRARLNTAAEKHMFRSQYSK